MPQDNLPEEVEKLPEPETELPLPEKDLPLPEKEITSRNEPEEGKIINDQNAGYSKTENNLGGKAILIIILLIILYPIGVIFMWFKTGWPKWVKFLLTIPLILGLIGLIMGIFFLSEITSNDLTDNNPPSEIQVTTPTPMQTVDEIASWKTYTDNKLGYSFRYPETLNVLIPYKNKFELTKFITYPCADSCVNVVPNLQGSGFYPLIEIRKYDHVDSANNSEPNDFQKNFDMLIKTQTGITSKKDIGTTYIRKPDIKIDRHTAYVMQPLTTTGVDGKIIQAPEYEEVYIKTDNSSYRIIGFTSNDNNFSSNLNFVLPENLDIFHNILTTFKFTESDVLITAPPGANPTDGAMVVCTMDAKLCSDGVTYVGRSGPNCEFEKCPSE